MENKGTVHDILDRIHADWRAQQLKEGLSVGNTELAVRRLHEKSITIPKRKAWSRKFPVNTNNRIPTPVYMQVKAWYDLAKYPEKERTGEEAKQLADFVFSYPPCPKCKGKANSKPRKRAPPRKGDRDYRSAGRDRDRDRNRPHERSRTTRRTSHRRSSRSRSSRSTHSSDRSPVTGTRITAARRAYMGDDDQYIVRSRSSRSSRSYSSRSRSPTPDRSRKRSNSDRDRDRRETTDQRSGSGTQDVTMRDRDKAVFRS